MSQKNAKKVRKEAKKIANDIISENMVLKGSDTIPVAGCPSCEKEYWILELDAYPPEHTTVTRYICANPICQMTVVADHKIIDDTEAIQDAKRKAVKGKKVPIELVCNDCGFEEGDCQCG